jgi:hypothetical protein
MTTKSLFRLCLCIFVDNQGALLCFISISCKKAKPFTYAGLKGHVCKGHATVEIKN